MATPIRTSCVGSFRDHFFKMRQGAVRRALPREILGEPPAGGAEYVHEIARLDYSSHGSSHRARVVRRHEESSLAVDHRLADPRRIRRDHRRRTRCRFQIADSPPFLWRRQRRCPRSAKKMNLLILGDESEELHPVSQSERVYQPFELSAIVAGAGNLERGLGDVQLAERADDDVYPLVLLEPPEINE